MDQLDDLLVDLGGVGKFQVLAYTIIELGLLSGGYWLFPMGYYIQKPDYSCSFADSVLESEREELC